MCGIVAFFAPGGGAPAGARLEAACATQALRGPDGAGTAVLAGGRVSLGHTRLAVLDLSPAADQPMSAGQGRHWLVFNGEIYNHAELRRRLEARGERLRTRSDTEVLLRWLMRHGPAGLDDLEGMFAFVHVDLQAGRLLAARDRIGVKPLYFAHGPALAGFASTLAPLRGLGGRADAIDPVARFEMLTSKYVAGPRTIYAGIEKVPPGGCVELDLGADTVAPARRAWWSPGVWLAPQAAPLAPDAPEGQWADALDAALAGAVARQLVADVPVGVLLSGGVDSSLVAALAARAGGAVDTFCVGWADARCDESAHARRVAAHLGTRHHELTVTPAEVLQALTAMPGAFDEPFGDASAVPLYLISRFARQRVTVALTGDGGDEQFFGYPRYHLLARARAWTEHAPGWLRAGVRALTRGAPRSRAAHAASAFLAFPDAVRRYEHFVLDNFAALAELCGAGPRATLWASGLAAAGERGRALAGGDFLRQMMLTDLGGYLVDDCLTKTDRATMACSLEARVPLLDEAVVRLSLAMPPRLSWAGGRGKHLLRRVLARYVPPALTERPKMGFGVPLDRWLFAELGAFTSETLARENLLRAGLDPAGVERVVRAHRAGRVDHQYFLWPLICYVRWFHEVHLAGAAPASGGGRP